ncbi:hypothetical protein K0M31_011227 [Melipona bicolor]|uniref:Uncharacterized protein n=1 Tax=Melipona bicolor TaxID=60889 RepID=A0AA40KUF0_9HYME|nr:hypothetical protein K0M31_011227 [Melipona bicolor]
MSRWPRQGARRSAQRAARLRGKISTLTGADVAHPGSRSQGILGAHLCALRPKTQPLHSGEAKRVTPWPPSPLVYAWGAHR